ncbi:unnamed protein product [Arabidopsis halleri]
MGKSINLFGFPHVVNAEQVRDFVENLTGSRTVYCVKVRVCNKGGDKLNARIQFTSETHAEKILMLADTRTGLFYDRSSRLKAYRLVVDLYPNDKATVENMMELKNVYFGYQITSESFSWLRRGKTSIGVGLRDIRLFLNWDDRPYRMEFPYGSIREVVLHSPQNKSSKFLVLLVTRSPKLYEKEENQQDFFMDGVPDDQWRRCTDFTSSCIGQSFAFCLELRSDQLHVLDYVRKQFINNYLEHNPCTCTFELGFANCYSSKGNKLVPVVDPPSGFVVPFEILFKVNALVQNACLPGPTLCPEFYDLLKKHERNFIDEALAKLRCLNECCYTPACWLEQEYSDWQKKTQPKESLEGGFVYIHQVKVTPTKVYFCGPEITDSNRVLRNFSKCINNFIVLSFVDEDFKQLRSTDLCSRFTKKRTELYDRISSVLRDGIVIGDNKFEFLAFSSSQLRVNSLWMFAPSDETTAASIRAWMGDFSNIRNVAKYAARLGQSFSSSVETLNVTSLEMELIPDVEIKSSSGTLYVFSDGIGKISPGFAELVAKECGFKDFFPSAFQIRYAGFKGVVAVDTNLSKKLALRKSMKKFESEYTKLDVLAWSKYQPCYLNRQLITLLSTLGVEDEVFQKKQREVVEQLSSFGNDPVKALDLVAPGPHAIVLKELISSGYKPESEPFLSMMVNYFTASRFLELRTKSRILIPLGRTLIGCLDESITLEYGQVFVQYSDPTRPGSRKIITGSVVVAKMPCLHPGDIRVLQSIDVTALHHLVDCVVFPQKGSRPHPNECSGSDLDGDLYFVSWDKELKPPNTCEPMDYTPSEAQSLDHEVEIKEIMEYFTQYIVDDTLGSIANAHIVFADTEPLKALSAKCLELAKLFTIAVDFPKTGVAAKIPKHLHVYVYPDFMEKSEKPSYESTNILGKLFREIKDGHLPISINSSTGDATSDFYDEDMYHPRAIKYHEEASEHKISYDSKLHHLMKFYGIKTEAEILGHSMEPFVKSGETAGLAVRSLMNEVSSLWFQADNEEEAEAKASAWYSVTYHPLHHVGAPFLSFPWCIYDRLLSMKEENMRTKKKNTSS